MALSSDRSKGASPPLRTKISLMSWGCSKTCKNKTSTPSVNARGIPTAKPDQVPTSESPVLGGGAVKWVPDPCQGGTFSLGTPILAWPGWSPQNWVPPLDLAGVPPHQTWLGYSPPYMVSWLEDPPPLGYGQTDWFRHVSKHNCSRRTSVRGSVK